MLKDHLHVLGLPEIASREEVKRRYREIAKREHPDRGGDAQAFKVATKAWEAIQAEWQLRDVLRQMFGPAIDKAYDDDERARREAEERARGNALLAQLAAQLSKKTSEPPRDDPRVLAQGFAAGMTLLMMSLFRK